MPAPTRTDPHDKVDSRSPLEYRGRIVQISDLVLWANHGLWQLYVHQMADDDMDKAYFRIDIIKDDVTNLGNIQISVNRRSFTLDTHLDLVSFPTGFSKALIAPPLESPLKTGKMHSMGYGISDTRQIVCQYYRIEEYTDFNASLTSWHVKFAP
jgi:hypothetical protein